MPKLRFVHTTERESFLREAYEIACTVFSEFTNDDACEVVLHERSAHLQYHKDLKDFCTDEYGTVILDVLILDSLS